MSEHVGRIPGRTLSPNAPPATLEDFVDWLGLAPASTTISAPDLLVVLAPFVSAPVTVPDAEHATTWRERLWVVPPETRLGVREAAEALGRPASFVYRHTSAKSAGASRLPHRRLDGELVFLAGELRTWTKEHEETIERGHADASLVLMRRAGGGA